jgi:hypothetical protein
VTLFDAYASLARPGEIADRLREWAAGLDLRLDYARADAVREIAAEIEGDAAFERICERRLEDAGREVAW